MLAREFGRALDADRASEVVGHFSGGRLHPLERAAGCQREPVVRRVTPAGAAGSDQGMPGTQVQGRPQRWAQLVEEDLSHKCVGKVHAGPVDDRKTSLGSTTEQVEHDCHRHVEHLGEDLDLRVVAENSRSGEAFVRSLVQPCEAPPQDLTDAAGVPNGDAPRSASSRASSWRKNGFPPLRAQLVNCRRIDRAENAGHNRRRGRSVKPAEREARDRWRKFLHCLRCGPRQVDRVVPAREQECTSEFGQRTDEELQECKRGLVSQVDVLENDQGRRVARVIDDVVDDPGDSAARPIATTYATATSDPKPCKARRQGPTGWFGVWHRPQPTRNPSAAATLASAVARVVLPIPASPRRIAPLP